MRILLILLFFVLSVGMVVPCGVMASCCSDLPANCDCLPTLYPQQDGPTEDIKMLQQELKQLGLYQGAVHGTYDTATQNAVMAFQDKSGLQANGIVGEETWAVLARAVEPVSQEKAPPPQGEVAIVIDVQKRKLIVLDDGQPYHVFPCAVGKFSTPSPVGTWAVKRKATHWGTGFGTRWMGLTVPWGTYGIHGTNKPGSIGSFASHGCIRMFNRNVEELYPWVKVGTPVYIIGNPVGPHPRPTLTLNSREPAVLEVQRLLGKHGYYDGPVDGIFGGGMLKAVIQFRADKGLPYDNRVDSKMYEILGL